MLLRRDLSTKWKMALSVGSMFALCGFLIPQADASSLTQKKQELQSLQNQASQTSQQLSQDKKQQQQLKQQIQNANQSIQDESQSIATNVSQMNKMQTQIQQLDEKISSTQSTLQKDQEKVQAMLRAEYENGNVSYLQVLFEATSWQDFLNRLDMLTQVTKAQNDLAAQVQKLEQQLQQEEQQEQATYQSLSAKTKQLQATLQSQQQAVQQKRTTVTQVSRDASLRASIEAELQSKIHYTKSQITEIQQQTAKDEQKMKSKSYVASAEKNLSNANAGALIAFAEKFQGLPYRWGGTSPSTGFDCSGFTQYVFRHFGINLPRTSESQFGVGVPVSRSNLKPGDLVFFATVSNGASHVGIYIGNGQMINSEGAGLMITDVFSPWYWGPRYLGARDVIRH